MEKRERGRREPLFFDCDERGKLRRRCTLGGTLLLLTCSTLVSVNFRYSHRKDNENDQMQTWEVN